MTMCAKPPEYSRLCPVCDEATIDGWCSACDAVGWQQKTVPMRQESNGEREDRMECLMDDITNHPLYVTRIVISSRQRRTHA